MSMHLSIVIPCYNEEGNVERVRRELVPVAVDLARGGAVELVFVDDGSRDRTWEALADTFGDRLRLLGFQGSAASLASLGMLRGDGEHLVR